MKVIEGLRDWTACVRTIGSVPTTRRMVRTLVGYKDFPNLGWNESALYEKALV